jgi:hypothetical protein
MPDVLAPQVKTMIARDPRRQAVIDGKRNIKDTGESGPSQATGEPPRVSRDARAWRSGALSAATLLVSRDAQALRSGARSAGFVGDTHPPTRRRIVDFADESQRMQNSA